CCDCGADPPKVATFPRIVGEKQWTGGYQHGCQPSTRVEPQACDHEVEAQHPKEGQDPRDEFERVLTEQRHKRGRHGRLRSTCPPPLDAQTRKSPTETQIEATLCSAKHRVGRKSVTSSGHFLFASRSATFSLTFSTICRGQDA